MMSNVYSLSRYLPEAILGQVLCSPGDDEVEPQSLPASQEHTGQGQGRWQVHPKAEHTAWPPGAIEAVFFFPRNEQIMNE